MAGQAPVSLHVPPGARARALGALVPRGEHAIAYATEQADALLAGFVLEGLAADERVLLLTGHDAPRTLLAKLRAHGVGPTRAGAGALRCLAPDELHEPWPAFFQREAERAQRDGFEALRAARLCAHHELRRVAREESTFPPRFRGAPRTLLCVYTPRNLRLEHGDALRLARGHARILSV